MLKVILVFTLFIFLFPIIGRFVLRGVLWMLGISAVKLAQREFDRRGDPRSPNRPAATDRGGPARPRRRPDGKIDVDYVPDQDGKRRPSDFSGGEYTDYEEVK
ncbi:MAG: hypothetical protein H7Z75_16400 [Ferruginibacter sp.]|nr:hypothetical protein [Cytophagales bacterium]